MKFYMFSLVAFVVVLTGCSSQVAENNNQRNSDAEGSYARILSINGEEYQSLGDENQGEYTISEQIGQVKKRVPPEVLPKKNLVSNYLNEGTLIFSVEEDSAVFLAEKKDERVYEIFHKSK